MRADCSLANQNNHSTADHLHVLALSRKMGTAERLQRICARPLCFWVLLILANAVALPYRGLTHDGRLYGVQVLNSVTDGQFANDLYLRYGSQDEYTIFSAVVSPIASFVGVENAFFLLYILFNSLFILAFLRLTIALVDSPTAIVFGCAYVAVNAVDFGGLGIFHVNESFFTARVVSNTFVLFSLERLVRNRYCQSFGFVAIAMLFHPPMAFCGLLTWCGVVFGKRLDPRLLIGVGCAAVVLGAVALSQRSLGIAVFGHMDSVWKQHVRDANFYTFPSAWRWTDWTAIAVACLINFAGAWHPAQRKEVRVLLSTVVVVALAGIVGSVLAERLPYRLLLQGQPYRALWLAQLMQFPVGCWLVVRLLRSSHHETQFTAIALVASMILSDTRLWLAIVAMMVAALAAVKILRISSQKRWPQATAAGVVGLIALRHFLAAEWHVWKNLDELRVLLAPITVYRIACAPFFVAMGLGLTVLFLLFMGSLRNQRWSVSSAAVMAMAVQLAAFILPHGSLAHQFRRETGDDLEFVRSFVNEARTDPESSLVVHWPRLYDGPVWFDLHAETYFSWQQLAGNMFNRETAIEGSRRATLLRTFDSNSLKRFETILLPWQLEAISKVYGSDRIFDLEPIEAELVSLCRSEELDYLVTRHQIGSRAATTNGRWYIYDCQAIRRTSEQDSSGLANSSQ